VVLRSDGEMPVLLVRAPREAGANRTTLLVPLDGSPFAEAALTTALDIASPTGELILVHVAVPPDHVERDELGRVVAYLDQQEAAIRLDAEAYLSDVARQLRSSAPALGVSLDVRIGEPARGIVMAAADRGAELVVMATHGRTGLQRAVLGSIAGEVLRAGRTPLLLVHPAAAPPPVEPDDAVAALPFVSI
jgi:nucleotide-binding universal stress UspA family protein